MLTHNYCSSLLHLPCPMFTSRNGVLSSDYGMLKVVVYLLAYLLSSFHLLDFQGNWERVRNVVVPKWVMYIRIKVLYSYIACTMLKLNIDYSYTLRRLFLK